MDMNMGGGMRVDSYQMNQQPGLGTENQLQKVQYVCGCKYLYDFVILPVNLMPKS